MTVMNHYRFKPSPRHTVTGSLLKVSSMLSPTTPEKVKKFFCRFCQSARPDGILVKWLPFKSRQMSIDSLPHITYIPPDSIFKNSSVSLP
jgi:hypothetical protein